MTRTDTHNEALRLRAGITMERVVGNILSVWQQATGAQIADGAAWYPQANVIAHEIAEASGYTVEQVAAVIAHLSPRQFWARNVSLAWRLAWAHDTRGIMSKPAERAFNALAASDPLATLKGPKTRAFALNILGDEDAVTLDVWAIRVAGVDYAALSRVGVYAALSEAYRIAARTVGVSAPVMQATTWIVQRGRAE